MTKSNPHPDNFVRRHIGPSPEDIKSMLKELGHSDLLSFSKSIIPNSIINYPIRDDGPDLLFFHILEPQSFGEDYTDAILEVLDSLKITRYIRIGGMYDAVPHTRPILVTGSAQGTLKDTLKDLIDLKSSSYQGPTSIVNLISDGVTERGIDNLSLMAHLPQYVQLEEDFAGASSLLEVICKIYDLPTTLADPKRGRQQYRELNIFSLEHLDHSLRLFS